jgi:hypothetical protein
MMHAHRRAAAPRKIAAAKVVAENWRSEEAALKVEVGLEALPDSELEEPEPPALVPEPEPVAAAEEPEPVLEPEPVAAAPLDEAAVTKPEAEAEAEALPEVAVEEGEVSAVECVKRLVDVMDDVTRSGLLFFSVNPYQLCGRAGRSC